jgi:Dullard-like phosphatase family protein
MMQKKIKIHDKEKKIKNQRSTSINYQSKIIINNNEKHFLKTNNNNLNTSDFETNPIDSTITSDSTTTTDTTKRIYIYRKNISKQKSSLGVAKQNSKKNIKPLNHCTSTDNLNKNKKNTNRFNTLETLEYNNNCRENTINNDYFQKCDDKKINKINDTTPNRKYYKFNNYTINSGPNIFKKGTNLNKYFYNQQNFYNNSVQKIIKKNEVINIEDLLLLEEKFNDIIYAINNKSNIANECFELINFYNQSSLYNKFENYFKDFVSKKTVHSSILLTIFDIILVYHISYDISFFNTCYDYLSTIMKMNHQSYLLLCDYISNKVSSSEKENIWVKKLRQMLKSNIIHLNINNNIDFKKFIIKKNLISTKLIMPLVEINYYIYNTQKYLTALLKNLSKDDDLKSILIDIYNNIFEISSDELYKFFRKKIYRIIDKNASVGGSDISLYETNHVEIKVPYLNFKNSKTFTLVLDLDETLICFKISPEKNKGLLKIRPGLFPFLLNLKKYYELIIFTSATPEYADPLLNAIEKGEKIFDYKLYRQHTIIYNNEFVKDISKLGRNLDKIIIVDNLPQNFRLQKENGIMIKPFWGEDNYDTALFDLCEILKKIAIEFDDVREGIINYKDDILSKVSSSVSRNSFQNYKY